MSARSWCPEDGAGEAPRASGRAVVGYCGGCDLPDSSPVGWSAVPGVRRPLELYDANDDGVIDADELITAALDHLNGHIDRDLAVRVLELYLAGASSTHASSAEVSPLTDDPWKPACTLYDENKDGAIDRDEVINAINDYLFNDTIDRDTVIVVIKSYLFHDSRPSAPTILSSASKNSLSLTWHPVSGAQGYKVEQRLGSSDTSITCIDHVSTAQTVTHTATNLKCNTTYQFEVRAMGDGDTHGVVFSSPASISRATLPCSLPLPPAPKKFSAEAIGMGSIQLTWQQVSGVEKWALEYRTFPGGVWVEVPDDIDGADSAYIVSGLACGTTYEFEIVGYGDGQTYGQEWGGVANAMGNTKHAHDLGQLSQGNFESEQSAWNVACYSEYHFEQRLIGNMPTPAPTSSAPLPDPGVIIPAAIPLAATAWNGSHVGTSWPHMLFCEKDTEHCNTKNTDGNTVIINVVDGGSNFREVDLSILPDAALFPLINHCGDVTACVVPPSITLPIPIVGIGIPVPALWYLDPPGNGHMGELRMRIEEPAWHFYSQTNTHTRFVWTNDQALHNTDAFDQNNNVVGTYKYLPGVVIHEFGHTAGLTDLGSKYAGYLMRQFRADLVIPYEDREYLRQVYRNEHGAKPH